MSKIKYSAVHPEMLVREKPPEKVTLRIAGRGVSILKRININSVPEILAVVHREAKAWK